VVGTALAAVVVSVLVTVVVGPAAGSVTAGAATPAAAAGSPALVLVSQSTWVTPGQAFSLTVHPSTVAAPSSQLGLTLTVYSCLTSVSDFDQSVSSSTPSGSVLSSTHAPLPLSSLSPEADGSYGLSIPVTVGAGAGSAPFTIQLPASGGQCGSTAGVYPVRVALVDLTTSQVEGGFTTHLVFTDAPAGTQRLRFAFVLPVGIPLQASDHATTSDLLSHPGNALRPPEASSVDTVAATVERVAGHPDAPVTLAVSPQTVEALRASGGTGADVVDQLADLAAATPARDQLTWSPYVPVDASALVGAGLGAELARQVVRGSQVLAGDIDREAAPPGAGQLGAWVTDDPLDASTLTELETAGYTQVVLPATSVVGPPTDGSASEPFLLPSSGGTSMMAITADGDVADRFAASDIDPVLAAHQLVAELAQIYYEKPNDVTPRAVVAVPPSSWTDDPEFVSALLGALTDNPIVQPVTVDTLLTTLAAAPCKATCRTAASPGEVGLPVAAIRRQRQRVDSFATAAPTATDTSTQLGDLVLSGESELLRPSQQSRVLHNTGRALDAQLGQFAVSGDRTITLTSQKGTLPIDIESAAAFAVNASLTVTSDKLLFPNGSTEWTRPGSVQLRPGTNIIDVPVTARSSGQFSLDVTVRSTDGRLVLSEGQISVRSTATSVVAIVLSLGALAVLGVWWFRTSRKRRAARQLDEAGGAAAGEPG
jgi:hypothetical protein